MPELTKLFNHQYKLLSDKEVAAICGNGAVVLRYYLL